MLRKDSPNNTPAEVEGFLSAALDLVEELGPPDDLREAFFVKAVDLLAGKQILWEQPQPVDLGALSFPRTAQALRER